MLNKIEGKFISRIISNGKTLTLLIKNHYDDINPAGSVNFLHTIFFQDDGIAAACKIILTDGGRFGILGFSGKIHVESQGENPLQYQQFFIRGEDNDKIHREIIIVCKEMVINSDPFLYSPMK